MKSSEVESELIFLGNRVVSFNLKTNVANIRSQPAQVAFDLDYNLKSFEHEEGRSFGLIDYIVNVKATIKKKVLFKIELVMEGAFRSETFSEENFKEMVEVNGLIALSQISRAYILSVTAQSGINPPIRVPMIDFNKLIEQKRQANAPVKK